MKVYRAIVLSSHVMLTAAMLRPSMKVTLHFSLPDTASLSVEPSGLRPAARAYKGHQLRQAAVLQQPQKKSGTC